jgi:hypothetical protein
MANLVSGYGTEKPGLVGSRIAVKLDDAVEEDVTVLANAVLIKKSCAKDILSNLWPQATIVPGIS